MEAMDTIAMELRDRRRRERSEADTARNNKWLARAAAAEGLSPSDVEDRLHEVIIIEHTRGW